jgi:hypothetical protein
MGRQIQGLTTFILACTLIFEVHAQAVGSGKKSNANKDLDPKTMDVTDQQRFQSQTFIHEGLSQRKLQEECAKLEDPAACMGKGKTKFMGMDSSLVKALSKAYSMVVGALNISGAAKGGGSSAKSADAGGAQGNAQGAQGGQAGGAAKTDGAQKTDKEQTDYCSYIPMGTEAISMFMQQSAQNQLNNLPTNQETVQKDTVFKAARSH